MPYLPVTGEIELICIEPTEGVLLSFLHAVSSIIAKRLNLLKVITLNTAIISFRSANKINDYCGQLDALIKKYTFPNAIIFC
jgi:hypothetical protein